MEREKNEQGRHIPNDVIFNILSRLPAKSLVRFKRVCKAWCSFITQLKYHNHKLVLSAISSIHTLDIEANNIKAQSLRELDIPPEDILSLELIGSCNGLLCIHLHLDGQWARRQAAIIIWNPWTGRQNKLSISDSESFDERLVFGFGYDRCTDDYKIITISARHPEICYSKTSFTAYSLKRRTWKSGTLPWHLSRLSIESGTFLDGALYWRVEEIVGSNRETFGGSQVVLRFDLKNPRKSTVILPPNDVGKKLSIFDLCDYGGHLCIVHYHGLPNFYDRSGQIDLWIWEQNWIKLLNIPCPQGINNYCYYLAPVFFLSNDEILMHLRYSDSDRYTEHDGTDANMEKKAFFIYSPKDETLRNFKVEGVEKFYFHKVMTYTQSLVSPGQTSIQDEQMQKKANVVKAYSKPIAPIGCSCM